MHLNRLELEIWLEFLDSDENSNEIHPAIIQIFKDIKNFEISEIVDGTDYKVRYYGKPSTGQTLVGFINDLGSVRLRRNLIHGIINLTNFDYHNHTILTEELQNKLNIAKLLFELLIRSSSNYERPLSPTAHLHLSTTFIETITQEAFYEKTNIDISSFSKSNPPFNGLLHAITGVEYHDSSGIFTWVVNGDDDKLIDVRLRLDMIEESNELEKIPLEEMFLSLQRISHDFGEEYLDVRHA